MKKNYFFLFISCALILGFSSCTKTSSNLKNIPETAFVVATIDFDAWKKAANYDLLNQNSEYQDALKNVEQFSPKLKELAEKIVENPTELGINFDNSILSFADVHNENIIGGFIIDIKKEKLEANIKLVSEELDFPINTLEKDGITYYSPEKNAIIGWDKNKMMGLYLIEGFEYNIEERFFNLMTLEKKQSILNDKDFKVFLKNCKNFNIWISSNVAKNMPSLGTSFIEAMIGFKISDNYGHIHFDIRKEEWVFTTKLRFNESIQKADWAKISKQLMDLGVLDEIIGKNKNKFNFDDIDEFDFNDFEMSDEDFDAFFEALNEID